MMLNDEMEGLYIGLDVGQRVDKTVLTLLEKMQTYGNDPFEGRRRVGNPHYNLVYVDWFKMGLPMPQQIDRVLITYNRIMAKYNTDLPLGKSKYRPELVIDLGNVGRALFDQFMQSKDADGSRVSVHGINFTGGDAVTSDRNTYNVPKKDLAASLAVVLENDRLTIPEAIPERKQIIKEMASFSWKISQAGNLSAENLKDADHDDFVSSLMCAIWFAERLEGRRLWTIDRNKLGL